MTPAFAIDGLTVAVSRRRSIDRSARPVVDDVTLHVDAGETLGIVGESGSGKTLTVLGALGLLPEGVRLVHGSARLCGEELLGMSRRELRAIRGRRIGVVFQDPSSSLHPAMRIGDQLIEAIRVHDRSASRSAARTRAGELLERVGVGNADARLDDYPHQWSGGMRQRCMIAMAIAHDPVLIVADEPTTALDVTVQAQILDLLAQAREDTGAAVILITHDLGVVAETADRVIVMYDGRVIEQSDASRLFTAPLHPYTRGLLESVPRLSAPAGDLPVIAGHPPEPWDAVPGCAFQPRCPHATVDAGCADRAPGLRSVDGRYVACHLSSGHAGDVRE